MKRITLGYFAINKFEHIGHKVINFDLINYLGKYFTLIKLNYSGPSEINSLFNTVTKKHIDFILLNDTFDPTELYIYRTNHNVSVGFLMIPFAFLKWSNRFMAINKFVNKKDIILTLSEFQKSAFNELKFKSNIYRFPVPINSMAVIPGLKLNNGKFNLGFCGTMTPSKNLHLLLSSLQELKYEIPIMLHIISQSQNKQYAKYIYDVINKLKLNDDVKFYNPNPNTTNRLKIMCSWDVLINLTTDKEECFGRIITEAFLCGLPVITTNWLAVNELVKDNRNGFLLNIGPNNNAIQAELTDKIKILYDNKRLYNSIIARNIKDAKKFDYRVLLPKLKKYLNQILNRH